MKLIAESGGTKTQWCAVTESEQTEIISTIGLNPNFVSEETIKDVLSSEVLPAIHNPPIKEVWFYGAGCAGKAMEKKISSAIGSVLPSTDRTRVFRSDRRSTGIARNQRKVISA